jgi:hypothetical protein
MLIALKFLLVSPFLPLQAVLIALSVSLVELEHGLHLLVQ